MILTLLDMSFSGLRRKRGDFRQTRRAFFTILFLRLFSEIFSGLVAGSEKFIKNQARVQIVIIIENLTIRRSAPYGAPS